MTEACPWRPAGSRPPILRRSFRFVRLSSDSARWSSRGEQLPGTQGLRYGPRLRDASTRLERRIAIEDLGDRTESVVAEVMRQWREKRTSRLGVPIYLEVRESERAEKECPHRALMVRPVPTPLVAAVAALVARVVGREASQSVGRQKMAGAGIDDLALAFGRERALGERDGIDLIRPERVSVSVARIDDVVTVSDSIVPEATESRLHARRELVPRPGRRPQSLREGGHRAERVVPECVDFDGLARTRGDDPVPHPRIHPGELDTRLTGSQETVRIFLDPVTRALTMEPHDLLEHRKQLLEEPIVVCRGVIGADRLDIPERCIHRVVLGLLACVGESVR